MACSEGACSRVQHGLGWGPALPGASADPTYGSIAPGVHRRAGLAGRCWRDQLHSRMRKHSLQRVWCATGRSSQLEKMADQTGSNGAGCL